MKMKIDFQRDEGYVDFATIQCGELFKEMNDVNSRSAIYLKIPCFKSGCSDMEHNLEYDYDFNAIKIRSNPDYLLDDGIYSECNKYYYFREDDGVIPVRGYITVYGD